MIIAICDDEKSVCSYLEARTRECMSERDIDGTIEVFSDGNDLAEKYKTGEAHFELVFLDIKMKFSDGVSVAKVIREFDKDVLIVFVTFSAEYVFTGYEVKAFRYILKNELPHAFSHVFGECIDELKKADEDVITIKSGGESIRLALKTIEYFESDLRKTNVISKSGTYSYYKKLAELETELGGKDFVRCHQSYLVNARQIKSIGTGELTLKSGNVLPISKSRYKTTKDAFLWSKR